MGDASSTDEFTVSTRFVADLEARKADIELFYSVIIIVHMKCPNCTTILKTERAKVEAGELVVVKVRGPFKSIYKVKNYVEALCGAGPAEVGLLYEEHLSPVWRGLHGFWLKILEFDCCAPVVGISPCSITVRPASEHILDRFIQRLEELNAITRPNFHNRPLPDQEQLEINFNELLDRCAEPDAGRKDLNKLPIRAKDRLMWMVREAGQAFQPTKIRRLSWKDMDIKREEAIAEMFPQAASSMPNLAEQKTVGLKRRFSLLDDQGDQMERMRCTPDMGNSPVKRALSPSIGVKRLPTVVSKPFVNSSVQAKHRGSLTGNMLKVPTTPPDVIIISDDDASGSNGSLNHILSDLGTSASFPEPNTLFQWIVDNYQPTHCEDDVVYKNDLYGHFSDHFGLEQGTSNSQAQMSSAFFHCLHEFLKYDERYRQVTLRGNTGIRSRKRFVCLARRRSMLSPCMNENMDCGAPSTSKYDISEYSRPVSPLAPVFGGAMYGGGSRPGTPGMERPSTPKSASSYRVQLVNHIQPTANHRPIIIDGSNVAMTHGNNRRWSSRGIAIVIEYFYRQGHREITVFIPGHRKSRRHETLKPPTQERHILDQLEHHGFIAWTPSRWIQGKGRVTAYDDRFIVKCAAEKQGIIVSNDTYRDLLKEAEKEGQLAVKSVIESKILMFTFVGDSFMPPDDPMGRFGPKIEDFLKH